MNPKVDNIAEQDNRMTFTLSNVNVSFANAIRRILLSDVPSVVFRTFPHTENKMKIHKNTTRLTNEILKQRLSCIPVYLPVSESIKDLSVEVNVKNTTDQIIYVTTKDFKIRHKSIGKYLNDAEQHRIFPVDPISKNYILFARLRPGIDKDFGEELSFTADLDIGTAKQNGMFSVVSMSSFTNTLDPIKIAAAWKKEYEHGTEKYTSDGKQLSKADIELYKQNWMLLEGQRNYTENSFDFKIETIGTYNNVELVVKSCEIMNQKLTELYNKCDTNTLKIKRAETTMENCYDIVLENETYTLGKVIEFILYNNFYNGDKILSFCGFKQYHPHDDDSVIRIAFRENEEMPNIMEYIKTACNIAKSTYESIAGQIQAPE
jgi:DNA-directed RNA polymerase subunit L